MKIANLVWPMTSKMKKGDLVFPATVYADLPYEGAYVVEVSEISSNMYVRSKHGGIGYRTHYELMRPSILMRVFLLLYALGLRIRRKANWTHVGSIPTGSAK